MAYVPFQSPGPAPNEPTRAQPAGSTTSSYAPPGALADSYAPRKSLDHPPGYVQNPYAQVMTPRQRFAQEHPSSRASGSGYGTSSGSDTGERKGGILGNISDALGGLTGVGGSGAGLPGGGSGEGGIMETRGNLAKTAGTRLAELEGEVWKRINQEK